LFRVSGIAILFLCFFSSFAGVSVPSSDYRRACA
jgi:hypothetical protein